MFIILESIALFYTISHNETKTKQFITSAGFVSGYWHKQIHAISEYFRLAELNEKLSAENNKLQERLSAYKAYATQDKTILEDNKYSYTMGRIIKNSVNHKNNYLTLDKGHSAGIKENMAVVGNDGIIGVIAQTSKHYSTIVPILNTNFQISGLVKKNGYFGTISWDGTSPDYVTLYDIPGYIDIQKGDTVVSSPYSSIFPEGIPIGTVNEIYKIKKNNFYKLKIKTTVDFHRLDYVYIIENKCKNERDSLENETENKFRFQQQNTNH